jgi:hypothetical protein
LVKILVPAADRDSDAGQCRGIGVVLSAHRDETFIAETEGKKVTLRLEKKRARWEGGEPHVRYRFVTLAAEPLPEEEQPDGEVAKVAKSEVTGVVWEDV